MENSGPIWAFCGGLITALVTVIVSWIKEVKSKKTLGDRDIKIAEITSKKEDVVQLKMALEKIEKDMEDLHLELDLEKQKSQEIRVLMNVFSVGFNLVFNQQMRDLKDQPDKIEMLKDLKALLDKFYATLEEST
ncbi:MAG: hypothetical protein ACI8ZM_002473 [Crocinitomix sp.]|jgi:hypothetical protein